MTSTLNQSRIDKLNAQEGYEVPPADESYVLALGGKLYDPGGNVVDSRIDLKGCVTWYDFHEHPLVVHGSWPGFKINKPVPGGRIIAADRLGSTITGGSGYTLYLESDGIGEITLCGFRIAPSSTAGVVTLDQNGPFLLNFEDCVLDGAYNHATNSGFDAKWGMIMHRWSGYMARTQIMNIKQEHCLYAHTLTGDTLIYDCHMRRTGRTNIQVCGRYHESGYGDAELSIQDCLFEDSGLHNGGSTLTLGGTRRVELKGVTATLGADAAFTDGWLQTHATQYTKAMGQGSLVNWSDKGRQDNVQELHLEDVVLAHAPNAGTAACAQLKAVDHLHTAGRVEFHHGYNSKALEFAGTPEKYTSTVLPGNMVINGDHSGLDA
jgi:hypothetical protein